MSNGCDRSGILTRHEKSLLIACPNCVSAKAKKTLIISLLLGWWGFPWGPIKTIQSIFTNSKALRSANYCEPTLEFIEFIKPHAAVIKAGIEKIKDLNELYNVIDAGKI